MKLYVIWGPPGSGKTTYVNNNKSSNDLIFDFDKLMRDISGLDLYDRNNNLILYLTDFRQAIINKMPDNNFENAWIIISFPKGDLKDQLNRLNAKFVLMDADKQTCIDRINADQQRKNKDEWIQVINNWFTEYEQQEVKTQKAKLALQLAL
jgi:hypothetical protein